MNMLKRILSVAAIAAGCLLPAIGLAETQQVGDYTWSYTISDGGATIGVVDEWGNPQWQRAVEPAPGGAVEIPSELGGCPVTGIGDCAFVDCCEMTSVTFPATVTSIGSYAFCGSGLTEVTIPAQASLGGSVFFNCQSLAEFKVEEGNAYLRSVNGCLLSKD